MRLMHSIFWDYFIDKRFGGPTGYLAHLRTGLDALPANPEFDIWIDCHPESHFPSQAQSVPSLADLMGHIRYFENLDNFVLSDEEFARLMRLDPSSVHLHTSPLAYKVIRSFKRHGVTDIPILVTSHTPESNGKEMADQYRNLDFSPRLVRRLEDAVCFVEALAFQAANIWVFPSREAMEPYIATIPKFETWSRDKDIRFVQTGAGKPRISVPPAEAKAKFGLAGRKVVSFIGRHNEVKGYDIFCAAAAALLKTHDDIVVLVAGTPNAAIQPPKSDRWIELGWYPYPGDVLAASDVFVLPNRMTYFDLVLIEALAMTTRVVASATGGNRTVAQQTSGAVTLFDGSVEDLQFKVASILAEPNESRKAFIEKMDEYYTTFYTEEQFARRYQQVIRNIYADYGFLAL